MADVDDLAGELRAPEGDPAGAIVLLHGRGTSEQDMLPLLDVFDPRERLVGAFPRGPLQLPPIGYHWYVVEEVGYPDPETFTSTYERLGAWLEGLGERTGVGIERTVIGGFSQGAVMAWALALGPGRPRPAGILAMSGFIPTVPDFELALDGLDGFPVAITHGTLDPVISVDLGRQARDRAKAAGADVVYRETDVPHIVDPRLIPGLVDWLDRRFLGPSQAACCLGGLGRREDHVAAGGEPLVRRHVGLARLGEAGGAGDALGGEVVLVRHQLERLQPELAQRPVGGEADRAGGDPAAARRPGDPVADLADALVGADVLDGDARHHLALLRRPRASRSPRPGLAIELRGGDPALRVVARVGARDARPARDLGVLADRDERVDVVAAFRAQGDHAVAEGRVGVAQHRAHIITSQ